MLDAQRLHVVGFVARGDVGGDQLLLPRRQRLHILEPAVDRRRLAVLRDQRVERLDQLPDRAVDIGLEAANGCPCWDRCPHFSPLEIS